MNHSYSQRSWPPPPLVSKPARSKAASQRTRFMPCNRVARILLVFGCTFISVAAAFGQQSLGRINGTVSDATGAVLGSTTVSISNEQTGATRQVSTQNNGVYLVQDLPIGTYSLSFSHDGFDTSKYPGAGPQLPAPSPAIPSNQPSRRRAQYFPRSRPETRRCLHLQADPVPTSAIRCASAWISSPSATLPASTRPPTTSADRTSATLRHLLSSAPAPTQAPSAARA